MPTAEARTPSEARTRWNLPELVAWQRDDPRTMALSLGVLFLIGAGLGVFTLVIPHPNKFDTLPLIENVAFASIGGMAIIALADRLPPWAIQICVAIGSLAIARAIYYSHEPNAYYSIFYLWVALYSFYFLGRIWGFVQLGIAGAAYAWVITQVPTTSPVSVWMTTMVSLAVAGLLIDVLARHMREREAESAARARALAAIDTVAHELALRTTTDSAAKAICEAAAEVAAASGASLWEPTSDAAGLHSTAATDPRLAGQVVLLIGQPSGAIRAFNTRESFFVADAPNSSEVDERLVERLGVSSVLFQPIMRDSNPIGVLVIWWAEPVRELEAEVSQVVALLAAEASIAIERTKLLARLEQAARTDDLTGLPNRRAWDEHLGRELARAKRVDSSLCVAMMDLDHFKEFNDRHGHQGGDRFLKEAAAAWQSRIRETDLIARYGGEEFAIALLDCDLHEATEMLDLVRLETPEGESTSAGVAAWDGSESEAELVARADAALYEAKRAGRDRVVAA
jgi:diguanylate cyclase (GGDEF)-like protein